MVSSSFTRPDVARSEADRGRYANWRSASEHVDPATDRSGRLLHFDRLPVGAKSCFDSGFREPEWNP